MNKQTMLAIVVVLVLAAVAYFLAANKADSPTPADIDVSELTLGDEKVLPVITPIAHASFVLTWDDLVIYNDPVSAEAFAGQPAADILLVSDVHGDHLNIEALEALVGEDTAFIVPQAVAEELPEDLQAKAMVVVNGQLIRNPGFGIEITAIPMYNLETQGIEIRHEAGRGNGYLLEKDGARIYIAGDTADIPEMRSLTDIDVAFVPMNLPYTMSVEDAASGVAAFKPVQVYPYHYRTPDGPADVALFKQLVNEAAPEVEVVQLDWYPE